MFVIDQNNTLWHGVSSEREPKLLYQKYPIARHKDFDDARRHMLSYFKPEPAYRGSVENGLLIIDVHQPIGFESSKREQLDAICNSITPFEASSALASDDVLFCIMKKWCIPNGMSVAAALEINSVLHKRQRMLH